jgi:hypothetical protein
MPAAFYGMSFVVAIVLFFGIPLICVPLGFSATSAFVMMTIVINLHHFIVDGLCGGRSAPLTAVGGGRQRQFRGGSHPLLGDFRSAQRGCAPMFSSSH